jgi:hypothetical protein
LFFRLSAQVFYKNYNKDNVTVMNKLFSVMGLIGAGDLTGCMPSGVYQLPQAPQTLEYSREVNANFDALK